MGEHVTAGVLPAAVAPPLTVGSPSAGAPPQGEQVDQGQEATGGVELPPAAELSMHAGGAGLPQAAGLLLQAGVVGVLPCRARCHALWWSTGQHVTLRSYTPYIIHMWCSCTAPLFKFVLMNCNHNS